MLSSRGGTCVPNTPLASRLEGLTIENWKVWVIVNPATLKSTLNKDKLTIYPNPATNELYVKFEEQKFNIIITDVAGRILKSQIYNNNTALNISTLSKGTYFLTVVGKNSIKASNFFFK